MSKARSFTQLNVTVALAAVVASLAGTPCLAQDVKPAGPTEVQPAPGEIVVTAQRRAQNLQDVGVAVSAVSGNDLRKLDVFDSKDISKIVPGVSLDATASGGVNANLTIRGVSQSDFSPSQESPNSIYMDDVYLAAPGEAAFPLYDMARIEVVRGPQGTLFGQASSGGLVNFITNRPSKDWKGYAEIGFGSYASAHVEGGVGGPITDHLRFRIAARAETANGWWHNDMPGGANAFENTFYGIRGQVELDVADNVTARLVVSYDHSPRHNEGTYRAVPFYLVNGQPTPLPANVDAYGTGPGNDSTGYRDTDPQLQSGSFNNVGFLEKTRFSPTLYVIADLGSTKITSITNYTGFNLNYNEDCDGGPVNICNAPLAQSLHQFSQEIRANGKTGGLTYTFGGNFISVHQQAPIGFSLPSLAGTSFALTDNNAIYQTLSSYAAFGQLEYQIASKLSATIGLRYTHNRKEIDSKVYYYELGNGYSGGTGSTIYNPPLLAYDYSTNTVGNAAINRDNLWSGKAQIDYKANRDWLLYASVSRGVKGSGFNTNSGGNLTNAQTPFKPEHLIAYEAGSKLQFLDRKAHLNLSAFDYEYQNFQGYAFTGLQGVVGNYKARFYGAEADLGGSPGAGFRLQVGASYLHSRLHDVPTAYSGTHDEQGVGAPHWTVNGYVAKDFEIGPDVLTVQWSGSYIGSRYASIDNNAATLITGSFVHNARITYLLTKPNVEIGLFVDNISDKARQNFAFDLISTSGGVIRSYDRPRWFGGSVRKTF
jgi:iron complex outermembrane receptor protein